MNSNGGPLDFEAYIRTTEFDQGFRSMENRISNLSKTVQRETSSMDQAFSRLGQLAAGYLAFDQLAQLPGKLIEVRGQFQQLEIAFTTMLGSKAKSDQLLAEVVELASTTPFGLKDAAQATKQLLAYGSASGSVIKELRMLGDVAAGISVPIGDLTYLYGTLRSQGRAYAVDIRQFAGRGIPIYAELAKVLGVTSDKVNDLVSAGKVGFPQVEQAFKNMSGQGGMFFNLMEKQSASLTGLTSQLKDAVDIMFNDIGKSQEGALSEIIKFGISATQNYKAIFDVLGILVATYGAYKAAVIAVNAVKSVEATTALQVATNLSAQSGATELQIALDVKLANATAARTAALASQAIAEKLNTEASLATLRTEIKVLAAKKATALQTFRTAEAEEAAAALRVGGLTAQQAAISANASAELRGNFAKEVSIAQTNLLSASERRLAAEKTLLAAGYDFGGKKIALETTAKRLSTLSTKADTLTSIANTAAKEANTIASTKLTSAKALEIAITNKLKAAQDAFNASLLSNPIVLATVAITALAAAIYFLRDTTTSAERAEAELMKTHDEAKKKREELTAATNELTSVINSNTATQFAQLSAYQKLQGLYPGLLANMTLQRFQLLETAEAQRMFNQSMDLMDVSGTLANFNKATTNVKNYQKQLDNLIAQQKSMGSEGSGLDRSISRVTKNLEDAKKAAASYGQEVDANKQREYEANTPPEQRIKDYEKLQQSLIAQRNSIESSITSLKGMSAAAMGIKPILDNLTLLGLNKQIDDFTAKLKALKEDPTAVKDGGNYAYFEKLKTDAVEKQRDMGVDLKGSAEWNRLGKEISKAEKELEKYSYKQKKVAEKDKPQPFGSVAYYEQIARKADEALSKINPKNTAQVAALQARKLEAELSASSARLNLMPMGTLEYYEQVIKNQNEILAKRKFLSEEQVQTSKSTIQDAEYKAEIERKKRAVQSFQDELNIKKSQFELYQKYIDAYGKTAADAQFAELIKKDGDYVGYLSSQVERLQSIADFTILKPEDLANIALLNDEINQATGKETVMEKFKKDLDLARESSANLTDYLEVLKTKQEDLATAGNSEDAVAQRKEVAEQILATTRERKMALTSFLQSVAFSEEKQLEIKKHYDDLKIALDVRYNGEKTEAYQRALDDINYAEGEEVKEQKQRLLEQSKEFKALSEVISETGRDAIRKRIEQQKDLVAKTKKDLGEASEEYKKQVQKLKEYNKELSDSSIEAFGKIAGVLGELGGVLSEMGGTFGGIGSALSGAASGISNLQTALTTGPNGEIGLDNYVAAAKGAIQLVGIITSSAKARKEAEAAYLASVTAQQQEYNLALNEEIGIRSELANSVFTTDYEGKLIDGIDKATDAQKRYQESLEKLDAGRAKNGQRNAVDWGAVGKGASAGASIGAVVGSVIPVIGNVVGGAVGAIVGGLAGLFGGKKKKDSYVNLLDEYPELIQKSVDGVETLNIELAKSLINQNLVDDSTKVLLNDTIAWAEAVKEANEQIESVIKDLAGSLGDDLRNALVTAFEDGTSSAKAFGDSVSKVIENIVSQLLFQAVFGASFKKLEDRMKASYAAGGDGSLIDDLENFFQEAGPLAENFNKDLQAAKDQAASYGLDIFAGDKAKDKNALSGQITSMSEETGSLLAGQFNQVRIYTASMDLTMKNQLTVLNTIATHTVRLESVEYSLLSIDRTLKAIQTSDPLRALGR